MVYNSVFEIDRDFINYDVLQFIYNTMIVDYYQQYFCSDKYYVKYLIYNNITHKKIILIVLYTIVYNE